MKDQRRGRSIAMTPDEISAFLLAERTCRVATVTARGTPHNTPLWFVWDGRSLWLNSVVKSQRWTDLLNKPTISVLVDGGHDFGELRGVEMLGEVSPVGDVPRTSTFNSELEEPERLFGEKYAGGSFQSDGRHAWLKLTPDKIVSWDFRKMANRAAS